MLFKKPLFKLDYLEVEKLKVNKIPESEILDYKNEFHENDKHKDNLLKEVTSFSNSSGGFLIYGIEETGKGGYPKEILGIDKNINLERWEQIIISNIRPRISVQFKKIDIPDSEKIVLIIRIPEGQNQPYYNNNNNKFYKRYNFEAKEMDEHEIEALYQKRFFGVGILAKYVDDTIIFNRSLSSSDPIKQIDGHIIITPLKVNEKIFDTSNIQELNFDPNNIRYEPNPKDLYLHGIASPSKYGIKWKDPYRSQLLEIHRNGFIHYMKDYGSFNDELQLKILWDYGLAVDLLQTIQFSSLIYSTLDFIGKVKIILKAKNTNGSNIIKYSNHGYTEHGTALSAEDISIEREWDSWRLNEDYREIGKNIMDELSNHYGSWASPYFYVEDDEIKFKKE